MSDKVTDRMCKKCSEVKQLSSFPAASDCKDGRKWTCRSCSNIRRRELRLADPDLHNSKRRDYIDRNKDKIREQYLNKQFGISLEDFSNLEKYQEGLCAICGKEEHERHLSVDHCHETLEIRGLLCKNCNLGLGHFKDDFKLLVKAACYLQFAENRPKVSLDHVETSII